MNSDRALIDLYRDFGRIAEQLQIVGPISAEKILAALRDRKDRDNEQQEMHTVTLRCMYHTQYQLTAVTDLLNSAYAYALAAGWRPTPEQLQPFAPVSFGKPELTTRQT